MSALLDYQSPLMQDIVPESFSHEGITYNEKKMHVDFSQHATDALREIVRLGQEKLLDKSKDNSHVQPIVITQEKWEAVIERLAIKNKSDEKIRWYITLMNRIMKGKNVDSEDKEKVLWKIWKYSWDGIHITIMYLDQESHSYKPLPAPLIIRQWLDTEQMIQGLQGRLKFSHLFKK